MEFGGGSDLNLVAYIGDEELEVGSGTGDVYWRRGTGGGFRVLETYIGDRELEVGSGYWRRILETGNWR